MKLITVKEDKSTLESIDKLVKEGAFNSRAEVYRSGAMMMLVSKKAQRLASLNLLNKTLFKKEANKLLKSVTLGDIKSALSSLKTIEEALRLRSAISPVLGEPESEAYSYLADNMSQYYDAFSKYEEYDEEAKNILLESLKRDLSALKLGLDEIAIPEELRKSLIPQQKKPLREYATKYAIRNRSSNNPYLWKAKVIRPQANFDELTVALRRKGFDFNETYSKERMCKPQRSKLIENNHYKPIAVGGGKF